MGARAGFALKFLQWLIRGVQFCCAGLVLAIYSYFLATLHNHGLEIAGWIRAVEGISGAATLYTAAGLALLCCVAGYPLTSFLAMVLDVCFVGAFIYVAQANRGGAGSCNGQVDTPFGSGDSESVVVDDGHGGFTSLPKLRQACQLETACLAVSIVAIFFFIFSILVEVQLARHRSREKRFGPGPDNDYTSGYGRKRGILGWLWRRRTQRRNDNTLPEHTHPEQLDEIRPSYATDATTAVGADHQASTAAAGGAKHGETGVGYGNKYGEAGNYGGRAGSHPALTPYQQHLQQQGRLSNDRTYGDGVYDRA